MTGNVTGNVTGLTGSAATTAMGTPQRLVTPQFAILMAAGTVYFLGMGGLNAQLPPYVVDELGGTETTSGIVMGSVAVTALATRAFFGRTADRRGARRIIVMGALLAAVSMLVLIVWTSVTGAIVSRLFVGAGGAAFMTGATVLSMDLAPPERRSQAAAFILVSFHAGMGTGPLLLEALREATSYRSMFVVVLGLVGAATAIGMLLTHRPGDPNAAPTPLVHRAALGPGVVTFLGVAAFNGFLMFVPLYAREIGVDGVGLVFLIASITIVVIRVLFGHIPDVIGPVPAGSFALALTVVAAVVIAMWATPFGLAVGAGLVAAGLSLQSPSFMKMAVDSAPENERGSVMATFGAFYDIANALVGPILGITITAVGYRYAFLLTGASSALALVLLLLVVAPRWRKAPGVDS